MENRLKEEIIELLTTLKVDAEMALNGDWDVSTQEGREEGFGAQIQLIDQMLYKLKSE